MQQWRPSIALKNQLKKKKKLGENFESLSQFIPYPRYGLLSSKKKKKRWPSPFTWELCSESISPHVALPLLPSVPTKSHSTSRDKFPVYTSTESRMRQMRSKVHLGIPTRWSPRSCKELDTTELLKNSTVEENFCDPGTGRLLGIVLTYIEWIINVPHLENPESRISVEGKHVFCEKC